MLSMDISGETQAGVGSLGLCEEIQFHICELWDSTPLMENSFKTFFASRHRQNVSAVSISSSAPVRVTDQTFPVGFLFLGFSD